MVTVNSPEPNRLVIRFSIPKAPAASSAVEAADAEIQATSQAAYTGRHAGYQGDHCVIVLSTKD